jgi:hypothetical protein
MFIPQKMVLIGIDPYPYYESYYIISWIILHHIMHHITSYEDPEMDLWHHITSYYSQI